MLRQRNITMNYCSFYLFLEIVRVMLIVYIKATLFIIIIIINSQ